MSDDVASSSPAAAPAPAAAPSETPTSTADLATLAAPEDASDYAEQRKADTGQNTSEAEQSEPQRRMSKYQRLKAARDRAQAEAAELRTAQTPQQQDGGDEEPIAATAEEHVGQEEIDVDPAEKAARQEAALREADQRALNEIEAKADYRARERIAAAHLPNYAEVMKNVADIPIPDHLAGLLMRSAWGPVIGYTLARDVNGLEELFKLKEMNPTETARWVGRAEATLEASTRRQQQAQPQQTGPRRVTQARKPMVPLRGGGGPPPSIERLADNMENYARTRLPQLRGRKG